VHSIFTVTSAASDTSLLSIAELRAAAGVTGSGSDAKLAILGAQVSLSIAAQCGVAADGFNPATLLSESCSEVFRLYSDSASIRLARRPVSAIAAIVENDETLDAADYELDRASGLLRRLCDDSLSKWPCGKITVTYTAGYSSAPADLKLAASKLVTSLNSETARDPSLKREDIPGVREVEYWVAPSDDPLLSDDIRDLIAPYQQVW
jgi:hypothetical protein